MQAVGRIEKSWTKPTKFGKPMYFVNVAGLTFSDFGEAPEWLSVGLQAEVEYEQKGEFRNITAIKRVAGEAPQNTPAKKEPTTSAPASRDIAPASEISPEDVILSEKATLMNKCYTEVEKMLGHKPNDTEIAMINSLFIEVNRRQ